MITETTTARDTRAALPSTAGGFAPRARPDARVSFNSRASLLRSATVRAVAACVLIGFAVRLLLVACVESVLSPDGVVYAGLARQLAAGNLRAGLSSYYPPLYPLLIALSSLVFRDVEFAGRFVSVAAGALLIVPVYLLAREWYGHRVARLAAIIAALHPLLIYYSSVLLTESTYTLAFTCGVLAGWRALGRGRGGARAQILAGAVFGACYLLKPEAVGFVVLLIALRVGAGLFGDERSFKQTLFDCAALACGFALLALPYLLYLRGATGAWTISGKVVRAHLWQGNGRAGEFVSATSVPDFVTALVQAAKGLMNEYNFLGMIFSPPFVALAMLGLFRTSWTRVRARRELYLAAFVAATLAGYAVTLPNIRFLVPLLPILVCWLARGIVEFEGWLAATLGRVREDERDAVENESEERAAGEMATREASIREANARKFSPRVSRLVVASVVAVLLASLIPLFVFLLRGDKWGDYHGQKVAAVWIKEHTMTPAPRIMATAPVAVFYAGGEYVALAAQEDYAAFVERARRERADFIIANERSLSNTSLRVLLDAQAEHPGLRLVHEVREAPGHKMLVYTVESR